MKKFIRYLYEYQNGRRVQNTGFVKVNESEDSAEILIYGKRFQDSGNRVLEIFVFYMMGNQPVGISMGTVTENQPMFGYRLEFDAEDVGGMDIFRHIEGIILISCPAHSGESQMDMHFGDRSGCRWYGAVWNERPINIEQMMRREEILRREEPQDEGRSEVVRENPQQEDRQREREEEMERIWPDGTMDSGMNTKPEEDQKAELGPCPEPVPPERPVSGPEPIIPLEQEEEQVQSSTRDIIYKITRQDMAKLPRREWKLANNQFLLHGCRNYHHLVSFEKDGKCWLGVPGVYHPQEQQAALAFGFDQFMKPEEGEIELTEEERNDQDNFGYWCRAVSSVIAN